MRKNRNLLPSLAALVTVLMFMNLFAFVLMANAVWTACDTTPTAEVSLDAGEPAQPVPQAESPVDQGGILDEQDQSADPEAFTKYAGSRVYDEDLTWGRETEIEIFHAWYDTSTGEITVDSDDGDSLIAPGTDDQYYFHIKNTGNVSLKYDMRAEATVTFTRNGENLELPLVARFSSHKGEYLVGGKDAWENVTALDGVTDSGVVSPNHYAKYTLQWEWPYESGNDELDTMLGDMAAAEEEITVKIAFFVNAEADTGTGGIPQTGDTSNIALWAGVFVCSGVLLIILMATRKKEDEDA